MDSSIPFDSVSSTNRYAPTEPQSIGGRLRIMRLRQSMTLVELATKANLDVSYLSRLERDVLQNAKPKPDTINRVLDALQATPQEREAVYHVERAPLTPQEIISQVLELASSYEDDPEPLVLRDEHWCVWYYNHSARAALALTREEYPRSINVHMLHEIIDPEVPRYSRVPEDERKDVFSLRARMFQLAFAGEEFDSWYQDVVARIYHFPWAAELWEHPMAKSRSLVIERQDMTFQNPVKGKLRLRIQLNRLMSNPRFVLTHWTPLDADTKEHIEELREYQELSYNVLPFYRLEALDD